MPHTISLLLEMDDSPLLFAFDLWLRIFVFFFLGKTLWWFAILKKRILNKISSDQSSLGRTLIPSTFSTLRSRACERYVLRISDAIAFFSSSSAGSARAFVVESKMERESKDRRTRNDHREKTTAEREQKQREHTQPERQTGHPKRRFRRQLWRLVRGRGQFTRELFHV